MKTVFEDALISGYVMIKCERIPIVKLTTGEDVIPLSLILNIIDKD